MKKVLIILLIATLCSLAVGAGVVLNAFNSGELSPLMEGRSDILSYHRGLRDLENMTILPQGPVVKRPGLYYIADANVTSAVRVLPFEHDTDTTYVIELGSKYMRFYAEE